MADGPRVDFFLAIEIADARHEIAERENAADIKIGQPEGLADLFGGPPFLLHEPGEGLPLRNLVGVEPRDILDQRGFQCGRIVAVLHDRARQRIGFAALLRGDLRGMEAARSGDDLECLRATRSEEHTSELQSLMRTSY